MMTLKRIIMLIFTFIYIFYDNWIPTPSCIIIPNNQQQQQLDHLQQQEVEVEEEDNDLKVMMVSDLMLSSGSSSGYGSSYYLDSLDLYFKDYYFSRFFTKSFEFLKPDMLIVLGDVSAQGSELTRSKWTLLVQQFHNLLGPFLDLPYHVVPGDRDIGKCNDLDEVSVNKVTRSFPGLDSSGCGAFDIANISFVSLNSVALLCGNNALRFSVEKALEIERSDMQAESEHVTNLINEPSGIKIPKHDINWRENDMSSGSGPVLLLHIPLHQTAEKNWRDDDHDGNMQDSAESSKTRTLAEAGPYELSQTLPPNATEYIFHVLRPRLVFSAHAQRFSDRTHPDGTREIVVPAMSWDAGNDPEFVAVTFRRNGTYALVSHCKLSGRSHVLIYYISLFVVFVLTIQTSFRS